jgi:hypothetical protein
MLWSFSSMAFFQQYPADDICDMIAAKNDSGSIVSDDYSLQAVINKPYHAYCAARAACAASKSPESDASCFVSQGYGNFVGKPNSDLIEMADPAGQVFDSLCGSFNSFQRVDAVSAIGKAAMTRQVVMINDVHDTPQTRLMTLALLKPLWEQGYRILAVEALTPASSLRAISKLDGNSGYYTLDPTLARVIQRALDLGYKVVPYDVVPKDMTAGDIQAREAGQAVNLKSIIDENPGVKLLVHAGLAHIYKVKGKYLNGIKPMAANFKRLTGINPLSVDQVYSFDAQLLHTCPAAALSVSSLGLYVYQDKKENFVSLKPGQFDISVFSNRDLLDDFSHSQGAVDVIAGINDSENLKCNFKPGCFVQVYKTDDPVTVSLASGIFRNGESINGLLVFSEGNYVLHIEEAAGTQFEDVKATIRTGN